MKNRIEPRSIRRDVPHTSVSNQPAESASSAVLESFPAAHPRGSWPAEEFAAARRAEGIDVTVVMNLARDTFDVKAVTV